MKYMLWIRVSRLINGRSLPQCGKAYVIESDNDRGAIVVASDCVNRLRKAFGPDYAVGNHLRRANSTITCL